MNVKDNPGDLIKASGPNIDQVKVIERMVKEDGAQPEDLFRAFPGVSRAALKRWHLSLTLPPEEAAAAVKAVPDDELGMATTTELLEEAKKTASQTVEAAKAEAQRIIDAAKAEAAKVLDDATKPKKKGSDPLA